MWLFTEKMTGTLKSEQVTDLISKKKHIKKFDLMKKHNIKQFIYFLIKHVFNYTNWKTANLVTICKFYNF